MICTVMLIPLEDFPSGTEIKLLHPDDGHEIPFHGSVTKMNGSPTEISKDEFLERHLEPSVDYLLSKFSEAVR